MKAFLIFFFTICISFTLTYGQRITIAEAIEDLNEDFIPDKLGEIVTVQGVVFTPNFQAINNSFYIDDGTAGTNIFMFGPPVFSWNLGDLLKITGEVIQFRGLTGIWPADPSGWIFLSAGNLTPEPVVLTLTQYKANPEAYEGRLIGFVALTMVGGIWPTVGSSSSLQFSDGVDTIAVRIDSDTDIPGQPEPTWPQDIIGVASQYSFSDPPNDGYQILPRWFATDFLPPYTIPVEFPFGMFEISPEVELYGSGEHVDGIDFWKAPDVNESLMFVTAKDNSLVEVWKYPFGTNDEQTPLTHSSFISGADVNGVQVDNESDLLFISIGRPSNSISVFSLPDLQFVTNFNSNGARYHREPALTLLKLPNGDKQLYVSADDEVFIHNVTDFNSPDFGDFIGSFNDLPEIEPIQADNYYQNIIIPDEQDKTGVYAFYPDGSPYPSAGENNFGAGVFQRDAEGILLYNCTEEDQGEGFFVISDQLYTQSEFEFFDRASWAHYGTMKIEDVDNSSGAASFPYPVPGYPMGIFATTNDDESVVLVSWEKIFTRIENIINATSTCVLDYFETFQLTPKVELNGSGEHVDGIDFWKAPDVNESLMFVTAKDNSLVEVWKYPFGTNDEQTPLTHSSFISGADVNGVQVDNESDLLFISIGRPSNSISVFSLPDLQFVTNFNSNGARYHREPALTLLKLPNGDKQLYVSADDEVFIHNVTDFNSPDFGDFIGSFNDLPEIEPIQADNYYQNIIIPDEQDKTGVYAFYPDGSPYPSAGENNFGAGVFQRDAEGILLYNCTEEDQGEGFFVISDQLYTQSEFEFFDRASWAHYGTMKIEDVDNSSGVASFPYPVPGYPMGIFATTNDDESVVLVCWEEIFTEIQMNKTLPKILIASGEEIPIEYSLNQNYPNPFNSSTVIKYAIPQDGHVTLDIYSILGERVTSLVNEVQKAGRYEVQFDASDLASGIYFYRIVANDFVNIKKMVLMK